MDIKYKKKKCDHHCNNLHALTVCTLKIILSRKMLYLKCPFILY